MSNRSEIFQPNETSVALIETLTLLGHDGDAAFFQQRNAGRLYPHFDWDIYVGYLPGV